MREQVGTRLVASRKKNLVQFTNLSEWWLIICVPHFIPPAAAERSERTRSESPIRPKREKEGAWRREEREGEQ